MSRLINLIVIHCSGSPNGRPDTIQDIDRVHKEGGFVRQEQWSDIQNPGLNHVGYHFVVGVNGALWTGRHLDEIGAHVKGFNQKSIGICLIGTDKFTLSQWETLKENVTALRQKFPLAKIVGHRDLSPDRDGDGKVERAEWLKDCPNFDVEAWIGSGMKPPQDKVIALE